MFDLSDTDSVKSLPTPRLSVRFDRDGTWSAWRGAIPLATGLLTVGEAWGALDQASQARPPVTPVNRSATPQRRRA